MAYNSKFLSLVTQGIADTDNARIWLYQSTDADATVAAANYISDAQAKGMKVNDLVIYTKTDTSATYFHTVTAVAATGATLSTASVPLAN